VLLNLSLNALDAMPRGGKLTVEAKQHESGILIAVADTGIGIDDDVLPRIFQPFFTSKKRRGLGLGLPICDRIVKSHGGKIIVKSRPGDGTKFEIYLPRVPPGSSATAGSEDATAPAPGDRRSAAPQN
jgi:signal transduction histidine kinase